MTKNQLLQFSNIKIRPFSWLPIDSRMYVLAYGEDALIIDACSDLSIQYCKSIGIRNCTVLLTHEHYDHIRAVELLKKELRCQVICTEPCAQNIVYPEKNAAAYFAAMYKMKKSAEWEYASKDIDTKYGCKADFWFRDLLELDWHGLRVSIRETPGHSPGSALITINDVLAFTGDSLIPGRETEFRMPGGAKEDFYGLSAKYYKAINPNAIVLPGHGDGCLFKKLNINIP